MLAERYGSSYKDIAQLIMAARNGRKEIIELLLNNVADINARDKDGNTPLMLALAARYNYKNKHN